MRDVQLCICLFVCLYGIRPLVSCSTILRCTLSRHTLIHLFYAHSLSRDSLTHSLTHSPSPLIFTDPHLPFATFTHLSRFCDTTVVVIVVVLDTVVVTLAGAVLLGLRPPVVVLVVVVVVVARVLKRVVTEAPLHLTRLPETTQV